MPVLVERPEITSFITAWQNKPKEQAAEELASYSLETKRIPDPYYFIVTKTGELFSPTAHCRIKDAVEDKTGPVGSLEYQALLSIEKWAAQNNDGAIVWISPPYQGVYPVSKIIVSEIEHEGNAKKLFNRAIVLDFDEKQCMKLAWDLTSFSLNRPVFTHLDQIRATPLILDTEDKPWVSILEELIDDPALWIMIRNEEDKQLKKAALRQATMVQKQFFVTQGLSYSTEARMAVMRMLGPRQGSCPPKTSLQSRIAFQVFSENALTYSGSTSKDPDFCKNCPVCGAQINCIVRAGGSCPSCKAVKRCG